MNKYIKAIKRYEEARQLVSKLTEKKRALVSDCDNMKQGDDHHNWELRNPCLVEAYNYMQKENSGNGAGYYDDGISYDDALDSDDIGTVDGVVCEKCLEAYSIKKGAFAEAKKEFGAAKRSLTALGKQIIRGDV